MNTTYRKNLKDVATACKNYTDQKIEALKWELGSHTLDVESDTDVAYTKTVPVGTIGCTLDKIGGMSYKSENLFSFNNVSIQVESPSIISYTINSDNSITITNTGSSEQRIGFTFNYSGTISISFKSDSTNGTFGITTLSIVQGYINGLNKFENINYNNNFISLYVNGNSTVNLTEFMIVQGSTALPYQPYFEGIRDSAVTSVVSKDSNATTLDTLTIPAEVQALEVYGWGVNDTCYNYIYYDITRKKWFYVQKVGKYTFTGNESFFYESTGHRWTISNIQEIQGKNGTSNIKTDIPNIYRFGSTFQINNSIYVGVGAFQIADSTNFPNTMTSSQVASYLAGKTIYYELATPVETDISEYIDDGSIEVEAGGTLIFTNTYEQAVPSEIDYLIEEVKA